MLDMGTEAQTQKTRFRWKLKDAPEKHNIHSDHPLKLLGKPKARSNDFWMVG